MRVIPARLSSIVFIVLVLMSFDYSDLTRPAIVLNFASWRQHVHCRFPVQSHVPLRTEYINKNIVPFESSGNLISVYSMITFFTQLYWLFSRLTT
jgi:hypothetical protein